MVLGSEVAPALVDHERRPGRGPVSLGRGEESIVVVEHELTPETKNPAGPVVERGGKKAVER
jgi:hypothetical protein